MLEIREINAGSASAGEDIEASANIIKEAFAEQVSLLGKVCTPTNSM